MNQAVKKNLPIDLLQRGRYQPRQEFDPDALQELANSILAIGIVNELIVRAIAAGHYEIIGGERRWRAAQLAGLHEVPCKIVQATDEQTLQIALIDNLARENLSPIEEARGIQRLIDDFQYDMKELVDIIGKPRPTLANLLRLLELHHDVQTLILKNKLSESHGKILLTLPKEKQYYYAKTALAKAWSTRELDTIIKHDLKKPSSSLPTKSSGVHIERLERQLSDYLAAAVKIQTTGKAKGFMKIPYNSLDELEGILARIGWKEEV